MLSQPRIAIRDALAGAAVLGVLAIVVLARQAPPFVTDSDFAMTELYTELAARGQLAVGSYSRFGWHHPGPFYFYLQAPIYAAGGHRAMSLFGVALLINLAAILTLVAVTVRANRGLLLIGLTAACVAMAWRAPRLLASPWVGHIAVFPALAFVAISAAIIAGRARWLPLAIVFGSFIAQTHLAFAPPAGVLGAGAIAAAVMHSRRGPDALRAHLCARPWSSLRWRDSSSGFLQLSKRSRTAAVISGRSGGSSRARAQPANRCATRLRCGATASRACCAQTSACPGADISCCTASNG